jgi:four helix bundle protein
VSTVYVESVALAADVRDWLSPIAKRDQDLARRLKRAVDGVPLHIAEGMYNTGRSKRQEYRAALGSAREALACVRAAESVGYLKDAPNDLTTRFQHVLDRILSLLE